MDALVTLNQKLKNEVVANVLAFSNVQQEAGWLTDFADQIRLHFVSYLIDLLSDEWSMENITVGFINGAQVEYSVDVDFTLGELFGQAGGETLPTTVALLVSTAYIGPRPNRGRIYFAGMVEQNCINGIFSPGLVTAAEEMVEAMANGINVPGGNPFLRIMGRPNLNRPNYVSNPIDLVTGRDIPATQRRRRLQQG